MSEHGEQVEVTSRGTSHTIIGGGDNGPWWMKYSMQAGFMFILILVLWGAYDLFKTKLPTLVEPVSDMAESVAVLREQTKTATEAQLRQATALDTIAKAQEKSADAHKQQAEAIERWVNMQNYRTTMGTRFYGPPEQTSGN